MIQSLWLMIAPESWYLRTAVYISDSLNITFKQSIYSAVGGYYVFFKINAQDVKQLGTFLYYKI